MSHKPIEFPGWWCSRDKGHEGPCALRPTEANFVRAVHFEMDRDCPYACPEHCLDEKYRIPKVLAAYRKALARFGSEPWTDGPAEEPK